MNSQKVSSILVNNFITQISINKLHIYNSHQVKPSWIDVSYPVMHNDIAGVDD